MEQVQKKRKSLGIVVAVITVFVAVGLLTFMLFRQRQAATFEEYLELGARYMEELNYEDAVVAFQKAIQIDPKSREANLGLAGAYEGSNQYDQAEATYLTVTEKFPEDGEAYLALAELYIRLERQEEAKELLEAAVSRMDNVEVTELYSKTTPKMPTFSLEAGTYDVRQAVEIQTEHLEEIIYYTIDGTEPDENSLIYQEPIILSSGNNIIKAKVLNSRGYESETASVEYQLNVTNNEITFEDSYIENFVRNELGIWGTPVYENEAAMITSLTVVGPRYQGIDANGITFTEQGYLYNGFEDAEYGMIVTLADLKYMPFLREVRIAYQENLSLTGIEICSNLQSLSLLNNGLTSLNELRSLTKLEKLSVGWNRIVNLSPISNLTNLQTLSLWGNQVSDLAPIAGLTKLQYLDIADNRVSDLTPLQGMISLKSLWMYNNRISDLTPLLPLENLSVLMLRDNPLTDYTVLKSIFPRLNRTDVSFRQQGGTE